MVIRAMRLFIYNIHFYAWKNTVIRLSVYRENATTRLHASYLCLPAKMHYCMHIRRRVNKFYVEFCSCRITESSSIAFEDRLLSSRLKTLKKIWKFILNRDTAPCHTSQTDGIWDTIARLAIHHREFFPLTTNTWNRLPPVVFE